IECFERGSDLLVKLHSATWRQALVQRVADQRMGEAQPTAAGGDLRDDACSARLVEQHEQALGRKAGRMSERVEFELTAEHCGEGEDSVALGGQPTKPTANHVPDTLWNRK